ncbi:MAG: DUF1569 domain-containing protein [Planctomycetaceae bacterium]|nr:DUF1569 domain-containing protein [Planctomycetaceae bacterium]
MAGELAGRRRDVQYLSLDDFRADVERLAATSVRTVGDWSFGQILVHLAKTIGFSLDGFPFQSPWLVRKLVTLFLKNRLLHKKLPSGFKLPKKGRGLLPEPDTTVEEGTRMILAALDRLQREIPRAAHPALGQLTPEEWQSLHLRHAELHMSFALSNDE